MITQRYTVNRGMLVLVPLDHEAREHLASMPPGEEIEVAIYRREPNAPFANLFYKTMNLVGEAMQWRARNVRGWLALKTGRFDIVRWPPLKIYPPQDLPVPVPHGTGPTDMNTVELEAFWDEAREVIRKEVLPHVGAVEAEGIRWRIENLLNRG